MVLLRRSKQVLCVYIVVGEGVMRDGKGSSAIPLPSGYTSDSHSRVGGCGVVASQCHHDLDVGSAVSVGGFVWLLAVGTADRGVVARVSGFAVSDRTGVASGRVVLGTDCAGMVAGSTSLGWVPELLALVALGGGAERDVFGNVAFAVKHREACSTERLLGHFTDEGDNHGGGLFTLAAFRAGEPTWSLTHSERWVGGFDFGADGFGGGGGGDAMDDETSPSLADPGRCDREFVECIFEDSEVGFVADAQMLGRNGEDEVVCGGNVR